MRESGVQRRAWLATAKVSSLFKSAVRTVLFRTNTGTAWASGAGKAYRLADGSVVVPAGRPIALGFGLIDGKPAVGTADLNGWTSIVVTPEMVGTTVAVFTAIETKESGGGQKRSGQINYVEQVRAAGGIAGFAKSPEEAQLIISDYCRARSIK